MSDAKIAREWAEWVNEMPDAHSFAEHTAARYILDTTTPPTMDDVEWDYNVHAGLCAEHTVRGLVRMVSKSAKLIECIMGNGMLLFSRPDKLTPIPGTRLDLTPRLDRCESPEPDIDEDSANVKTDHPEVLATKEDYESAPAGTIVAGDGTAPWFKNDRGLWFIAGGFEDDNSQAMSDFTRYVLRWGENGCPKPSEEES